jgi:hypothetical protein
MTQEQIKPLTPEQIDTRRKVYQGDIDAESFERKDDLGLTSAEITQIDAEHEDWARNGGKDWRGNKTLSKDGYKEIANSNLKIETDEKNHFRLFGSIDGRDIDIKGIHISGNKDESEYLKIGDATIDGKPVDENEAKGIYWSYHRVIAEGREKWLQDAAWHKRNDPKEDDFMEKAA